ncbi:MAG: amidohydrolase family protein [Solobacterium sp.]|nr:amidohydrolase family protein [Solobacterium sp.]
MKYVFINGHILNGKEDMEVMSDYAVFVEGDQIVKIVPQKDAQLEGYETIDLQGSYLLPGLINMHAHLAAAGKATKPNEKPKNYKRLFEVLTKIPFVLSVVKKMEAGYAKDALMSGVTTVRTVGGILDLDGQNRDAILAGKLDGPRLLVANTGVSVPGGHFAGSLATEATSPEQAKQHVREIAQTKPDLIKLMITGGVMDASEAGEPGILKMPPEIVKAACEEAHRLGYRVAAHVESTEGVRVALENGVDTIEHGATPDEEILRLFKEKGAIDVCTLSPALPYAKFELNESNAPEIGKINGEIVFEGIINCAKACLENGIPVGMGSDVGCPFITHYNFWREVDYFHQYLEVSRKFSLYTATLRNAQLLGIGDITGSIEEGKCADLIVVKDNPLEDLKTLRNVTMVMARGKLYRNPQVKRLKGVDALLDKYQNRVDS